MWERAPLAIFTRRAATACLCLTLAACSALSPPQAPQSRVPRTFPAPAPRLPTVPPGPQSPDVRTFPDDSRGFPPAPGTRTPEGNAASAVLLERSREQSANGAYAAAAASLERALRIDPNNPVLWIELAEVKSAEGDDEQAEMMARKALTLAGSDRSIVARAERLVGR